MLVSRSELLNVCCESGRSCRNIVEKGNEIDDWREADQLKQLWYKVELYGIRMRAAVVPAGVYEDANKGIMNGGVWEWLAKADWVEDLGMEGIWSLQALCLSLSQQDLLRRLKTKGGWKER